MERVLTGGCQCGAVRYALGAVPGSTSICHCRMCQKAVGQPFAVYASVSDTAFAWTRGNPPAFRSSTAAERHFCPACGTSLTFRYFHKPTISVAVGTLDHPERVTPQINLGVESRLPWMTGAALDSLACETTDTPNTPEPVRTLTDFQHPDHDTPDGWAPPHGG
jgi:hypothetical protein